MRAEYFAQIRGYARYLSSSFVARRPFYPTVRRHNSSRVPSSVERRIGEHIATIVVDGATLQVGIGSTIDAL